MITNILQHKYPNIELYIKERTNGNIVLDAIRVPEELRGTGIGTQVMNDLCNYADEKNVYVFCTPSTELGGSSKSRLINFYKRFGFTLNKGRNKDFSEMQSMIRIPNNGINETLDRMKELLK